MFLQVFNRILSAIITMMNVYFETKDLYFHQRCNLISFFLNSDVSILHISFIPNSLLQDLQALLLIFHKLSGIPEVYYFIILIFNPLIREIPFPQTITKSSIIIYSQHYQA
jgi:hypothetical protein